MKKIISLFVLFGAITLLSGCKIGRYFWYNFSNITDYKIFPSRPLHGSTQPFRFIDAQRNSSIEDKLRIKDHAGVSTSMKTFLENSPTVAFLIIRNDSLLYERYQNDYDTASIVGSFSMAKSYVSALIGIAIGEGKIKSENDPVVNYLPELKDKYNWNNVTIHHVLHMASGVKFSEGYSSPFSGAASFYYGRTLRKSIAKLKTEKGPMEGFDYKSVNTEILGLIIERATGKSLTEYLDEKIWRPLQMEYDASWSIDRKHNGLEKAFCCINARARDFAKFGRLYLNGGNWNGQTIVPNEWVKLCLKPNDEKGAADYYNRQWWIGPKEGDFAAIGHLGQYIYVLPAKNLIVVRLGTSRAKEEWIDILRQVGNQM
jgi:CubicO group peptidase (beta-lactamase class C family)